MYTLTNNSSSFCIYYFYRHRTNCPSVGDERLLMASSLRSKDDGLAVKQISEFLF